MDISAENAFELVGVYFTNTYWNKIYTLAMKAWQEEQFDSVENAYRITMERYARAFCSADGTSENKHYYQILRDIYMQFKESFECGCTYLEFLDVMSSFFIPYEQYRRLPTNDQNKDIIIRKILTKTVMRFTLDISKTSGAATVVAKANRKDENLITNWKRKFIEILNQERNEFCALLLAKSSGIDISREDIPQIPKEVCDRMQQQIKELIEERADLIHERNKLVKYIGALKKIITDNSYQPIQPQPIQLQQPQPIQYQPIQLQQPEATRYEATGSSRRSIRAEAMARARAKQQTETTFISGPQAPEPVVNFLSALEDVQEPNADVFEDRDELLPDD